MIARVVKTNLGLTIFVVVLLLVTIALQLADMA